MTTAPPCFANFTALMTWVTWIPNMMEPQRHVVIWNDLDVILRHVAIGIELQEDCFLQRPMSI